MRTFLIFLFLINQFFFAQKIFKVNSLFSADNGEVFFDQVNASLYMPPSYSKVEHFVYEDEKNTDNGDGTITVRFIDKK